MEYTNPELLEAFYELKREEYPNLTKEQLGEIIYAPWIMLRKAMGESVLPEIRFKYFGVFNVSLPRAKGELKRLDVMYEQKFLDKERYEELKEMITNYVKENDKSKNDT